MRIFENKKADKETFVLKINDRDPEKSRIRKAASLCKKGKVVAFPTETVYGIGGRMSAPRIEARLREITGRPNAQTFVYYISDWTMLDVLRVKKTPLVRSMARQFWPGAVTLIVLDLTGKKIAIRFPRNKTALALIKEIGEPIIAAGASKNGKPSPHTASQVLESLHGEFDCLIDGGKTEFRLNSTIVDLTGEMPVVIRKGAQGAEVEKAVLRIQSVECPRKRILIVCTGNICRSPMAEGLIKREIEGKKLSSKIEVISCGTQARDGLPCTSETRLVMERRGMDLHHFRSRLCRGGDLWSSDLVFVMESRHARDLAKMLPSVKERIMTLNVDDPIGQSREVYEKTFLSIESKLKLLREKILRLD